MTDAPTRENPWTWMQPHDAALMGDVIFDPAEQTRWCRAVMLGGLPYMWKKKARTVRDMMFERMSLREGDRVLVIGESIESCDFLVDIRDRIGPAGEIVVFDITTEARGAYFAGERGRGGQLATWRWDYTEAFPDESFDCVAVLQAVQHTDDWHETADELLRLLRPGRAVVLAEITFSPQMKMKAELDLHIEYWMEKLFAPIGFAFDAFPYYSPEALLEAFAGKVTDPTTFVWKGVELFWGTKPERAAAVPPHP